MAYPMSTVEISYQFIVNTADFVHTPLSPKDLDGYVTLASILDSTSSMDRLDTILPFEEAIIEAMKGIERLRDDLYHRSYFTPDLHEVESSLSTSL